MVVNGCQLPGISGLGGREEHNGEATAFIEKKARTQSTSPTESPVSSALLPPEHSPRRNTAGRFVFRARSARHGGRRPAAAVY